MYISDIQNWRERERVALKLENNKKKQNERKGNLKIYKIS